MDTKKQIRLMTGIQDILATSQAMYGRCYLWSCKEDKKQQISTILAKNLLVRYIIYTYVYVNCVNADNHLNIYSLQKTMPNIVFLDYFYKS